MLTTTEMQIFMAHEAEGRIEPERISAQRWRNRNTSEIEK